MTLTTAIENLTNADLAMGVFALFVVVVSLFRIMGDEEFPALTATKKTWGRRRGLLFHFLSHVGLPLVFGVVFLTRGVAGPDFGAASRVYDPVPQIQIVQHFLDLQNQAAALIDHATMVLEVEVAMYGPSWFAQDTRQVAGTTLPPEVLPLWYQTIP